MKGPMSMWLLALLIALLSLPVKAGDNPYQNWESWWQHYPDYVIESADFWVTDRSSQIMLSSLLLAQPVLWKTDGTTTPQIREAGLLPPSVMRFSEAWGRMYGVTLLTGVSVFRALHASPDDPREYQQLEYVLTGYGTTLALAGSLKYLVGRTRPDGRDDYSFPSGHTTLAFTTAEMTRQLYGNGWGSAAYLLAVLTGIERIQEERHWLGDVVTAAILSTTIARSLAPGQVASGTLEGIPLTKPVHGPPVISFSWPLPGGKPSFTIGP
ncbi:MAG: phosphatase PAP2 family protein [Lentisphaeria bacterium]|nr:phosphatase PAP2 family protein [Lentisphaeria bacterium]